MIKADQALFLGFDNRVQAVSSVSGKLLWDQEVDGAVYGITIASGRLFISTDQGAIYAFGMASP